MFYTIKLNFCEPSVRRPLKRNCCNVFGKEGTPLYNLFTGRYVQCSRAWFMSSFELKWGIDFYHFGQRTGYAYSDLELYAGA